MCLLVSVVQNRDEGLFKGQMESTLVFYYYYKWPCILHERAICLDERMLSTMFSKRWHLVGGEMGAEPFLNSQQIDKSAAAVKSCIFYLFFFKVQASNLPGGKLELRWHAPDGSASQHRRSKAGLLKIDIGEVLETISDPKIPADRELWGGLAPGSPGGTSWLAARYFLSERMLA